MTTTEVVIKFTYYETISTKDQKASLKLWNEAVLFLFILLYAMSSLKQGLKSIVLFSYSLPCPSN